MFSETFIYPPIKRTKTANKIRIIVNELRLFEFVRITVLLYDDSTDELIETQVMTLEGQDYLNWSSDDKYIVDWVKKKLNDESNNN